MVVVCIHVFFTAAGAAERCREPAGRLVSVQGDAQVQNSGQSTWDPVQRDYSLCPGDTLRVGSHGRVAVVLANESLLRIPTDQNSTLSFGVSSTGTASLVKLLKGILHTSSHRPRSLDIATPYVSGAVEGTEFLVQVNPEPAVIIVFEGKVRAVNGQGQLDVSTGQAIVAERGMAPRYTTVVRPREAVQWTLYYPFIIDRPAVREEKSDSDPLLQAVDNLAVGRVAETRALIAGVLAKDPAGSEAFALLAIIEVVQNNTEKALRLAAKAIETDPRSAAAGLALSYAQQARFDIAGALATVEKAKDFNPDSAEILARLAELQLSVGELDQAQGSARQAAALNPDVGRIQTVLGFTHLTRIETEKAQEHEQYYAKYFEVKHTPVRGTKVVAIEQALADTKRNYGYFALMSNDIQDAVQALEVYRNKDVVEKAFENLKERLNLRRLAVSSEQSLDGKLFVQFVALIYLSYITKKMQEKNLFKSHTLQEVLDELDLIECFSVPGRQLQVGEMTKRQAELYTHLGVIPPASLQ